MNINISITDIENYSRKEWNNLSESDRFDIIHDYGMGKMYILSKLNWDKLPAPLKLRLLILFYKNIQ